jgi:hypothetical protein
MSCVYSIYVPISIYQMYVNSAVINNIQTNLKALQTLSVAFPSCFFFFFSQRIYKVKLIILCGSKYLVSLWRGLGDRKLEATNSWTEAYFRNAKASKLHKATTNMNVVLYMCGNYGLHTDTAHVKSVGHKYTAFHPCVCNCRLTNFIVFCTRHFMKFMFSNNSH